MIKIIKEARLLEPRVKSMAKDILTTYLKCNKEYLKEKFNRKVKNDWIFDFLFTNKNKNVIL